MFWRFDRAEIKAIPAVYNLQDFKPSQSGGVAVATWQKLRMKALSILLPDRQSWYSRPCVILAKEFLHTYGYDAATKWENY